MKKFEICPGLKKIFQQAYSGVVNSPLKTLDLRKFHYIRMWQVLKSLYL